MKNGKSEGSEDLFRFVRTPDRALIMSDNRHAYRQLRSSLEAACQARDAMLANPEKREIDKLQKTCKVELLVALATSSNNGKVNLDAFWAKNAAKLNDDYNLFHDVLMQVIEELGIEL